MVTSVTLETCKVMPSAGEHYISKEIFSSETLMTDDPNFMLIFPVQSILRSLANQANVSEPLRLSTRDTKYLENSGSRYLLEDISTVSRRYNLSYFESSKRYDIENLCKVQRYLIRSLHCKYAVMGLYEVCEQDCENCRRASYSIDVGHGKIVEHGNHGLCIKIAMAIKL